MALTLETNCRNAMADAIDTLVNTGAGASEMKLETSADSEVALFTLQNPAFDAAGTGGVGIITLLGVTLSDTSAAGGVIEHFSIYNKDAAKVIEGVCATSGQDMDVTSLTVGVGDTVDLTAFTITMPA